MSFWLLTVLYYMLINAIFKIKLETVTRTGRRGWKRSGSVSKFRCKATRDSLITKLESTIPKLTLMNFVNATRVKRISFILRLISTCIPVDDPQSPASNISQQKEYVRYHTFIKYSRSDRKNSLRPSSDQKDHRRLAKKNLRTTSRNISLSLETNRFSR